MIKIVSLRMVREKSVPYAEAVISKPEDVVRLWASLHKRGQPDREEVWLLCLDNRMKPTALHMVSRGSLDGALLTPREVFKTAITANARCIILMHNHPSGDPTPSAVRSSGFSRAFWVLGGRNGQCPPEGGTTYEATAHPPDRRDSRHYASRPRHRRRWLLSRHDWFIEKHPEAPISQHPDLIMRSSGILGLFAKLQLTRTLPAAEPDRWAQRHLSRADLSRRGLGRGGSLGEGGSLDPQPSTLGPQPSALSNDTPKNVAVIRQTSDLERSFSPMNRLAGV